MKKSQALKWIILIIALAINVFIIVNAFLNGETSAKESNTIAHGIADVVNDIKPETITDQNFPKFAFNIRKVFGHFGLFALSGGFSSWAFYLFVKDTRIKYFLYQGIIILVFGLAIAILSELAQLITEGRSGNWTDVGIDFAGYFIGVLLVFLILLLKKSPIFHREK